MGTEGRVCIFMEAETVLGNGKEGAEVAQCEKERVSWASCAGISVVGCQMLCREKI